MPQQNQNLPEITMNPVKSSNLASCGHCAKTNTLAVQFKHGGTYHYAGFTAEQFAEMQKAKSIGKFYHANVRGKFEHTKL